MMFANSIDFFFLELMSEWLFKKKRKKERKKEKSKWFKWREFQPTEALVQCGIFFFLIALRKIETFNNWSDVPFKCCMGTNLCKTMCRYF